MRIAFMGTPDFAVPTLDALIGAGHDVAAVYSQPPRPAGRGKALRPSPVQRAAEAAGIEVRTPVPSAMREEQAAFRALDLDFAVVAAYGLILPQPILEAPRHGCLNVHASLLPRWRGAAPIQRAILAGDTDRRHHHADGARARHRPDARQWPAEIDGKTAGELTAELAAIGADLIVSVLAPLRRVGAGPQPEHGSDLCAEDREAGSPARLSPERGGGRTAGAGVQPRPGRLLRICRRAHKDPFRRDCPMPSGAPGIVLDDGLTIACADGALAPSPRPARRPGGDDAGRAAARLPDPRRQTPGCDPLPADGRI